MMSDYAPIVLFVYNRPDHMMQCIESLLKNLIAKQSDLYVFSDGPKTEPDLQKVEAVRNELKSVSGFKSVQVIAREQNFGLSKSIISGVTEIIAQHGRVIVLEDDLILSPYFLEYMNQGLALYAEEPKVASIHGYFFPIKLKLPETFFLKGTDCLGWGTWTRAWKQFETDGQKLLDQLKAKKITNQFNLDGATQNTEMLEHQILGKNNSWAIRWHASAYLNNQFTLFPKQSLVDNIGFDDSGTHCGNDDYLQVEVSRTPIHVSLISVQECLEAREAIKSFYREIRPSIYKRVTRKLKKMASQYV
jgi:glycosyltransferase involved in cell wall biosynthesis